jgi:hypothetical protein
MQRMRWCRNASAGAEIQDEETSAVYDHAEHTYARGYHG